MLSIRLTSRSSSAVGITTLAVSKLCLSSLALMMTVPFTFARCATKASDANATTGVTVPLQPAATSAFRTSVASRIAWLSGERVGRKRDNRRDRSAPARRDERVLDKRRLANRLAEG